MEMMDGIDLRNSQDFEEMQVLQFSWFLRDICCQRQSLKEATKDLGIVGIIAGIIFLLGAGGNFLIAGFRTRTQDYYGVSEDSLALGNGILALLDGCLLLTFNILLLNAVRDNRAARVFKTIKVGCLTLLILQLIGHLVRFSCYLVLFILRHNYTFPLGWTISGLVLDLLGLVLTIVVLCAIIKVKPNVVTIYVYFLFILFVVYWAVMVAFLGLWHYLIVGVIRFLLTLLWLAYCVELFALHANMMTITPAKNQHQLQQPNV